MKFEQTCGRLTGFLAARCHLLPSATIPFCDPAGKVVAKSNIYTKVFTRVRLENGNQWGKFRVVAVISQMHPPPGIVANRFQPTTIEFG
jgi:hypothetical protein